VDPQVTRRERARANEALVAEKPTPKEPPAAPEVARKQDEAAAEVEPD
jgi:hypothetical protein